MAWPQCKPGNCKAHGKRQGWKEKGVLLCTSDTLEWGLPSETPMSSSNQSSVKHSQYTLCDNEAVLHGVRRYLAAQNLRTITPKHLCHHVNNTILPTLNLTQKNTSIGEWTAVNWLKNLGYSCKDVKKEVYHDGHEHPDVIEARKKYLEQIAQYEQ